MSKDHLNWSFNLSATMAELDDAHHELEDLYGRILWACDHETNGASIRSRIRSFLTYARWHFLEEENLMRDAGYFAYADHKADHQRLLSDAEAFVDSFGGVLHGDDSPAVVSYFKYWLTAHMASADSGLIEFLNAARERHGEGLTADAERETNPANDS